MIYLYLKDEKNVSVAYAMLVLSLTRAAFERSGEDEEEAVEHHLNYTLH